MHGRVFDEPPGFWVWQVDQYISSISWVYVFVVIIEVCLHLTSLTVTTKACRLKMFSFLEVAQKSRSLMFVVFCVGCCNSSTGFFPANGNA